MAKDERSVEHSEGLQLLTALKLSQGLLAHRLGVTRSHIAQWTSLRRLPTPTQRKKIERELKIPAAAWKKKPKGEPKPKRARVATAMQTSAASADFLNMTNAESAARLRRNALEIMAEAETKPSGERAFLLEKAAKLLGQVGNLTGEASKITPAKILRHPSWLTIHATIERVLTGYPEAMRELGEALVELGKEEGS